MKVYLVADLNYDGGIIGAYTDKTEAEKVAKERYYDTGYGPRREYGVYEIELHGSISTGKEEPLN